MMQRFLLILCTPLLLEGCVTSTVDDVLYQGPEANLVGAASASTSRERTRISP